MSRGSSEPLCLSKKVILKASKQEEEEKGKNNGAGVRNAWQVEPEWLLRLQQGELEPELAAISSTSHARKQRGLVGVRAGLVAVHLSGIKHGCVQKLFT